MFRSLFRRLFRLGRFLSLIRHPFCRSLRNLVSHILGRGKLCRNRTACA
jgi:hypothetical protein